MTIDPYHFNEPLADDNLSDSQPKLQQNTNTIASVLGKNMVPLGQPNAGLFKQIDLQNVTTLPPAVSGFAGLYNLNGKLVFRDGSGVVYSLPLDINTFNSGYVNIGGFVIQAGTSSLPVNTATRINFPIRFPNECRVTQITPIKGGTNYPRVKLLLWNQDYFEANSDQNTNLSWVAFGR